MNINTTKDINFINLNSATCVKHVIDAFTGDDSRVPRGVTVYINDYDTDETVATYRGGDLVDRCLVGAELAWFTWDARAQVLGIEAEFRHCDECGEIMYEGFCVEGGASYYCSEGCLHKHFTPEEWDEMYDDGNGDSYWTQWY